MSLPVVPPLPVELQYPVTRLNLFPEYADRAAYDAAGNPDPPTFNSAIPEKKFRDDTKPDSDDPVTYQWLAFEGGQVVKKTITMTYRQAAQVNFQGVHAYPKYIVAATAATKGGQLIPAQYLSTPLEANQLAWAIDPDGTLGIKDHIIQEGESDGSDNTLFGGAHYPDDEPRRLCSFAYNGQLFNCGLLIKSMNANGVGTPGRWLAESISITWLSALPMNTAPATLPPMPVPQRPLDTKEKTSATPFGFVVYRDGGLDTGGSGGGGFTAGDRADLQAIKAVIVK